MLGAKKREKTRNESPIYEIRTPGVPRKNSTQASICRAWITTLNLHLSLSDRNLPSQLWNDPATADRDRKRMVRLLIEDVTIRKGAQVQLDVRFRGGMSKTLMLPRPLSFCDSHKQDPAMVAEMDRLLDDHNYADVARILNENGFKTGDGLPLTSPAVGYIRTAYGLKSRFDRLRERGMLTMCEIAKRCGVSTNTISDWRRKGRICALAINDRNQFLFEDRGPNPPRKHARRVARNHYSSQKVSVS